MHTKGSKILLHLNILTTIFCQHWFAGSIVFKFTMHFESALNYHTVGPFEENLLDTLSCFFFELLENSISDFWCFSPSHPCLHRSVSRRFYS